MRHLDQRVRHPLRVLAFVPGAAGGQRLQRTLHGSAADWVEDRVYYMHAVRKRADVHSPAAEVELFIALAAVRIDRIAHTPAQVPHLGHAQLFCVDHERLFVQVIAPACHLFVQVANRRSWRCGEETRAPCQRTHDRQRRCPTSCSSASATKRRRGSRPRGVHPVAETLAPRMRTPPPARR